MCSSDLYGHAGRMFVQALIEIGEEQLQARYAEIVRTINGAGDIQDKQRMAAAALLLADEIADEVIFQDDQGRLGTEELRPYLLTTDDVSRTKRAYEFLVDWITINGARFEDDSPHDRYGVIEGNWAYVIRSQFEAVMKQEGFSSRAVLSAWNKEGLIQTEELAGKTHFAVRKRIDKQRARYVAVRLPGSDQEDFLEHERSIFEVD